MNTLKTASIFSFYVSLVCLYLYFQDKDSTEEGNGSVVDDIKQDPPKRKGFVVEACVSDIESVREAIQGGVDSVELCTNRLEGGVTPSMGFVSEAVRLCRSSNVEVHVLIRPRPGLFHYTDSEFSIILDDIIRIAQCNVTGIVIGILTRNGSIDIPRMKLIRTLVPNIDITFHRAFDVSTGDLEDDVNTIISLGCNRLLTSGRALFAREGVDILKRIRLICGNKLSLILAGSIQNADVSFLLSQVQANGLHVGSQICKIVAENYVSRSKHTSDSECSNISNELYQWSNCSRSTVASFVDTVTSFLEDHSIPGS